VAQYYWGNGALQRGKKDIVKEKGLPSEETLYQTMAIMPS